MSKIVKKYRKQTYNAKRRHYKKYQNANWEWTDIFEEFNVLKQQQTVEFIKIISKNIIIGAR